MNKGGTLYMLHSGRRYQGFFQVLPLIILACVVRFFMADVSYAQGRPSVTTVVEATDEGASVWTGVESIGAKYHPSRALIRFRNGARDYYPGSGTPRSFSYDRDLFLVPNPAGVSVAEVLEHYRANPNVQYAEPDYVVETSDTTPSDTLWGSQWDMSKISAPLAWDSQTNASDVVVAIIDTGIDFTHPDLQDNLGGYDGSHGFTCIGGPCGYGGQDDHGHGTHVAGTIGATSNNAQGIAGINWHVQMIAFKFLNSGGSGYISDAIYAFQKIAELRTSGVNIRLTSNSWGGGGYSEALKSAMEAVEALGIVNVCAAGNSGQNADASPMYPAAYDNRGIISVAATDSNDKGASFTNYGLASVDLAAPGVSTLSTVPTGTCSLCDPTGYKYLSGTSMATPHVSGVMAALMHLNPSLTAEEARDVILDPSSYDVMTDAKARSTSTGGRLNFYKAITSSRLSNPQPLNNFPTLTMGPDIFAPGNTEVDLSATASDPDPADNANLRMSFGKATSAGSTWLFGWMLGSLFPNLSDGSTSFTTPALARTANVAYYAGVADNRGGGVSDIQNVIVAPTSPQAGPPTGTLSLSTTSAEVGSTITVSFPVVDPDAKGTPAWDLWAAGKSGSSGWCCYTGSAVNLTFNTAGVYRIGTQAIDRALDLSDRQTAVVSIGGATGSPPIASATLDKLEGQVPLTVNIDMSASSDPDGSIQYYFMSCGGGGFTVGSTSSKGKCTFSTPGTYWLLLQVQDNSGQMDLVSSYVVATPPGGTGPDAPTGLTATAGSEQVALSWQLSSGATSYNVKSAPASGGPYTTVKNVTATNYVDTGLTNGTTYYYVVSALNASGESANLAEVSAKPMSAPADLKATAGTAKVSLSWTASLGATSYNVKRKNPSDGKYTTVATATTASYVDTGLTNGTTYYYVVSATNATGESLNSNEASATPLAVPSGVTAIAGDTYVALSWTPSIGATSYNVKRATSSGGPYSKVATVGTTSHRDIGLTNGTNYYYMISAVNDSGESSDSVKVSAKPVASTLNSLSISPSTVKGGATVTGTVTLLSAPLVDKVVNLSSSATSVASVPASVTVAAGSKTAIFTITTYAVRAKKNAKIIATLGSVSKQQMINVTP